MTDLGARLERLGLSQYLGTLAAEGFDTWETVLDITESDLNALGVKLGHRRKLQRAIAETRSQAAEQALAQRKALSVDGSYRSDDSAPDGKLKDDAGTVKTGSTITKRKYRRHPKPDEHAPERPPSAYVLFSNHVRETVKGRELSFTEIAKIVGERWQVLSQNEKEVFERQATTAKEKYYAELNEYKKTPQYAQYQEYLVNFKAKHAAANEGKRTKLETEANVDTTASARRGSRENVEKTLNKRPSGPFLEGYSFVQRRSESSPPPSSTYPFPVGFVPPAKSVSPGHHPQSGLSSPKGEHHSPMPVSPSSTVVSREALHGPSHYPGHSTPSEPREHMDYVLSGYNYPAPHAPATQSPAGAPPVGHSYPSSLNNYPMLYRGGRNNPSRRAAQEVTSLPPLLHEDTSLSSDASLSSAAYQMPLLPDIDASKALRVLPQPVPTPGAAPSPLDQRQSELRNGSFWPALLKASELARDADRECGDSDYPP